MGGTLRKSVEYGFGAIFLYLLVAHATGAGTLLKDGAAGIQGVAKTLQGR